MTVSQRLSTSVITICSRCDLLNARQGQSLEDPALGRKGCDLSNRRKRYARRLRKIYMISNSSCRADFVACANKRNVFVWVRQSSLLESCTIRRKLVLERLKQCTQSTTAAGLRLCKSVQEYSDWREAVSASGERIGFVPTMERYTKGT